jgi:hypothetical protein
VSPIAIPVCWPKTATTADVLSQGRSVFGIGAAWYEREHLGLGVPYPPVRERFEMLEETLQICLQMWSEDQGRHEGKHYRLAETICEPQPIRRPPILIGGDGEKKTLRLVAQYADVWNATTSIADELAHKIDVLHRHCKAVGLDPADIRLTAALFTNPALIAMRLSIQSLPLEVTKGVCPAATVTSSLRHCVMRRVGAVRLRLNHLGVRDRVAIIANQRGWVGGLDGV